MISISFNRYIATPETITNKKGIVKLIYKRHVDHNELLSDNQCPLEHARELAHLWLSKHYGYVVIELDNLSEDDKPIHIRLSNRRKMHKDLKALGLEFTIHHESI